MKVHELMERLKNADPQSEVVMSQDPEGNGYYLLGDVVVNDYVYDDSSWGVEIGLRELTDRDRQLGYGEEDLLDGDPCVVLWPW